MSNAHLNITDARNDLLDIYHTALASVSGYEAVKTSLSKRSYDKACHVIAIGKAADAMSRGAIDVLQDRIISGIAVTKTNDFSDQLLADKRFQCHEGEHPVPTQASLKAGKALVEYIEQLPDEAECLILVSGGASSLLEVLAEGWTLDDLQALTGYLLANAYDIHNMNGIRRRISTLKGGGLWQHLKQRPVTALLISDVEGDDPAIIGSGVLFPHDHEHIPDDLPAQWHDRLPEPKTIEVGKQFEWDIIASLSIAKAAAAERAKELGYAVSLVDAFMDGDAADRGQQTVEELQQAPLGITIWGGETTVKLPDNPGKGGRNLHLALSAAKHLHQQTHLLVLSASTDGIDGVTNEAGALVDAASMSRGTQAGMKIDDHLQQADAFHFLQASGDLIHTGATGTNVMDLVIGLKLG